MSCFETNSEVTFVWMFTDRRAVNFYRLAAKKFLNLISVYVTTKNFLLASSWIVIIGYCNCQHFVSIVSFKLQPSAVFYIIFFFVFNRFRTFKRKHVKKWDALSYVYYMCVYKINEQYFIRIVRNEPNGFDTKQKRVPQLYLRRLQYLGENDISE